MTPELNQCLQNHDFLRGFSAAQIASLSAIAGAVVFEENDLVLMEGQRSSALYLLLSGSVAVELRTPAYVVCVEALGPGQAFGWSALLEHQDTVFQVRAREKTTAIRLEGPALQRLCQAEPPLGVEILRRTLAVVASRVKATEIRFAEMCGIRV